MFSLRYKEGSYEGKTRKNFKEGSKTNSYLFFQLQCDRPNNNWQNEVYTYIPTLFRMRMYDIIFDGLIFDKTAIDL